jgi:hypothetical protein
MTGHQLAQVNVAKLSAPFDAEEIRGFRDGLEPINALAERSPGFVWRLADESGDATAIRAFADEMIIVNLTVWESVEALRSFAYDTEHVAYLRRRREWFERMTEAYTTMWWVPAGHVPSVAEAAERLEVLRRLGPTPEAFTFRRQFAPPGAAAPDDGAPAAPAVAGG